MNYLGGKNKGGNLKLIQDHVPKKHNYAETEKVIADEEKVERSVSAAEDGQHLFTIRQDKDIDEEEYDMCFEEVGFKRTKEKKDEQGHRLGQKKIKVELEKPLYPLLLKIGELPYKTKLQQVLHQLRVREEDFIYWTSKTRLEKIIIPPELYNNSESIL